MISGKRETARLQSDFYRDKYRSLLRALLFSVCLFLALLLGIIYLVLFRPQPHYYATTTNGKIIPMILTKGSGK